MEIAKEQTTLIEKIKTLNKQNNKKVFLNVRNEFARSIACFSLSEVFSNLTTRIDSKAALKISTIGFLSGSRINNSIDNTPTIQFVRISEVIIIPPF
ncbi:MAG: hypothetical protein GY710_02750 [Desulfobacteraceae bacterium]|nr:hypothetical protein [Desulfobacteraceae bacterium]